MVKAIRSSSIPNFFLPPTKTQVASVAILAGGLVFAAVLSIVAFIIAMVELWQGDLDGARTAIIVYFVTKVIVFLFSSHTLEVASFFRLGARVLLGYAMFQHNGWLIALGLLLILIFARDND